MKKVALPKEAIAQVQGLVANKAMAEVAIQKFLEGCKAGLGLGGDWNLDIATWIFTKMSEKGD